MGRLKQFIKRNIICRHKNKEQYIETTFVDDYPKSKYHKECKDCGKVWK